MPCEIPNCNLKFSSFYFAPRGKLFLKEWQKAANTHRKNFFICENHFEERFKQPNLVYNAIPTLLIYKKDLLKSNEKCQSCHKKIEEELCSEINEELQNMFLEVVGCELLSGKICSSCYSQVTTFQQFCNKIRQINSTPEISEPIIKIESFEDAYVIKEEPLEIIDTELPIAPRKRPRLYEEEIQTLINQSNEFKCINCKEKFSSSEKIVEHMRVHHQFVCSICKANFLYEIQLVQHLSNEHKKNVVQKRKDKDSKMYIYNCGACQLRFSTMETLVTHLEEKHSKESCEEIVKELRKIRTNEMKMIKEKKFTAVLCSLCMKFFRDDVIKDHRKVHRMKIKSV